MIVLQRQANIASGKMVEAMQWAHKITGIFKEVTGTELEVMVPVGGNPFQLVWRGQYDSMADLEAAMAKTLSSEKYIAEITSAAELFIAGSVKDDIWQTM